MNAMQQPVSARQGGREIAQLRRFADQAFSRAAGASLITGNSVRLLRNAAENYPAWLDAISSAQHDIHFECYIIHSDEIGEQFAEALAAKAREGVRVRLIYDWLGALGVTSNRFWRPLRRAGVEVRCFNPPHLDSPFGWLSRDHRKMLSVDGRIAFVTGLCVGHQWVGDPTHEVQPWRDTGVAIQGPALFDIEKAFAATWAALGPPLGEAELPPRREDIPSTGDVALRIVASIPNIAGLYRLDQLIAAMARRSIWLTDPYFLGTTPYVEALKAAAMDGVDVRFLVPRSSDIPVMRALSRAGFQGLLEAGVRMFEWNGPMLHAKTAVADGRWARVGSSNLNLASWVENWELDIVAEDERFSQEMEQMFLEDLQHSTEIVLRRRKRVRPAPEQPRQPDQPRLASGSAGRAATGVLRISNAVEAAIRNRRTLDPAEARVLFGVACLLLCLTVTVLLWPEVLAVPVALVGAWTAISLLIKAHRLRDGRER